jgi:hypothetical protein
VLPSIIVIARVSFRVYTSKGSSHADLVRLLLQWRMTYTKEAQ